MEKDKKDELKETETEKKVEPETEKEPESESEETKDEKIDKLILEKINILEYLIKNMIETKQTKEEPSLESAIENKKEEKINNDDEYKNAIKKI